MSSNEQIHSYLQSVRARLNRNHALSALVWSLAVGAALLLVVCLTYVVRGHAVPAAAYIITGSITSVAWLAIWFFRLPSRFAAAEFGDQFFDLKDAVRSYLRFHDEGHDAEIYALQAQATATQVAALDVSQVRYEWPRRLLVGTGAVLVASVLLGFKPASQEVIEQIRVEAETEAKTDEINEFLEEMIDELEKASEDDEDLAALDPKALREWVDELKDTKDRKEAMRQYAELERRLQQAAQRLEQRKTEQLLAKAGEELQKDQETREMGRKLEKKQYRQAAEDAEQLKPEKISEEKLSEQRKELARLKSASQRMAAAAKAANRQGASNQRSGSQKQGSQSQANNNAQSGSGQNAEGASGASGGSGQTGENMEELMTQLDKSVKDLDKAMRDAELAKQLNQDITGKLGQCNSAQQKVSQNLSKLSQSLCKASSKSQCQSQLQSLCKKLGQCQSYLNDSKCNSLAQCMKPGAKPGGKSAGVGSVESRRNELDPLIDNGNTSQLQGIKGQGPSVSSVESADDGDGVSSRRTEAKQREFQNQLESFVQREDVPEDVKQGVKEYFKNIHRTEVEEQ